jgi:hypothetical protein
MLFGSTAQVFTGSDGGRTYFSKLPAGIKVKMGDQQAIAAVSDVLLSSGYVLRGGGAHAGLRHFRRDPARNGETQSFAIVRGRERIFGEASRTVRRDATAT